MVKTHVLEERARVAGEHTQLRGQLSQATSVCRPGPALPVQCAPLPPSLSISELGAWVAGE
jgi:hypothetical protein